MYCFLIRLTSPCFVEVPIDVDTYAQFIICFIPQNLLLFCYRAIFPPQPCGFIVPCVGIPIRIQKRNKYPIIVTDNICQIV